RRRRRQLRGDHARRRRRSAEDSGSRGGARSHPPLRARRALARADLHRESRRGHTRRGGGEVKKTLAVFKREYLVAVRKKMFIIMTFLMPLLMVVAFLGPTMLMERGLGDKHI